MIAQITTRISPILNPPTSPESIKDNTAIPPIAKNTPNHKYLEAFFFQKIANKIGTYGIAIAAKHFNIPFYVLCPPASEARSGKDIKIEIRPDHELLEYQGISLAPKGAKAYYPGFDVTPSSLITKHIYLRV